MRPGESIHQYRSTSAERKLTLEDAEVNTPAPRSQVLMDWGEHELDMFIDGRDSRSGAGRVGCYPRTMATDPDEELLNEFTRRMSKPGDMTRPEQKAFIENPIIRGFAGLVGVDLSDLEKTLRDNDRENLAWLRAAEFTRFGWTPSARGPHRHAYVEAIEVWDTTQDSAAVDECLTRWWNDREMVYLKAAVGPMTALAGRHKPTRDILLARDRLVRRALDHHAKGQYEASVMILLAQIDGLVLDFTNDEFGFFIKAKEEYFEDDETVVGMQLVLRQVWNAISRPVFDSSESDEFLRHGILHGRLLGFGTQANSTKAIVLLGGVIEYLGPVARMETERRQIQVEARWAGSDEVDAEGRRKDRRGFVETRDSLRWLAVRESNEHRQHGVYRGDLLGMFPKGVKFGTLARRDAIHLTVADDRQSWWAWAKTDSDFCFGIAGSDGQIPNRYYAGVAPPSAPDNDDRWTDHVHEPPDWEGE